MNRAWVGSIISLFSSKSICEGKDEVWSTSKKNWREESIELQITGEVMVVKSGEIWDN